MNVEKWSRWLFIIGIVLWTIAALFRLLPLPTLYILLGLLVCYLGIKNIVLVYIGLKKDHVHEKIQPLVDKYGIRKGVTIYMVFFAALYILIGLLLIAASFVVS